MGRAIDMEKDIDEVKIRLGLIEKALSRVINVVESMEEKGQRTTHVDLVEDVKSEAEVVEEKPKSKKSDEKAKRTKKD